MSLARRLIFLSGLLIAGGLSGGPCSAADAAFTIDEPTQRRCLAVLETAIGGDEFWRAMHAAEALTLAGQAAGVRERLAPLLEREADDQRRCGLACELGDESTLRRYLERK